MNKRTFNIQHRVSMNAGEGLISVPNLAVLKTIDPQRLIKKFKDLWQVDPKGVVLPVVAPDGLLFEVEGLSDPMSAYSSVSPQMKEFPQVISAFAKLGLDIYLQIDPALQFIRTDALHVVDILGDSSSAVCIGNARSREVIAAILGTSIDIVLNELGGQSNRLAGVVLDLVNLWPMGANNKRLELTCFCPSCEKYFNEVEPELLKCFRDFPNPWNLLLADSGTGISFVDEVHRNSTPSEIVGLSRQKGFTDIFDDKSPAFLASQAEILLRYTRTRHNQTLGAARDIFEQSLAGLNPCPKRIILCEGAYYGWTSGLSLESLDVSPHPDYDEVWFDPFSTDIYLTEVPFRSYMWKRASYFINHFFSMAANVSDQGKRSTTGVARLSQDQAKSLLRNRLGQAVGTAMTGSTSLASLPDPQSSGGNSQRIGFVGVALDAEIGKLFINEVRIEEGLREQTDDQQNQDFVSLLKKMMAQSEKD